MRSKRTRGLRATALEVTRRGRKVPESLVRRLVESRQREVEKAMKATNAIRRRAGRDMRAMPASGKRTVRGAPDAKTMAALRKATRHVSRDKLLAPVVAGELGGLLNYTFNFTPPYDYVLSDGDLEGSGNVRTADLAAGTLNWNIEDETNDGLLHFGLVELGSFFFLPADQKILSVRSNPSHNWSWWIASAGPIAAVDCQIEVGLAGFKGVQDPWVETGDIAVFDRFSEGAGFQFDMGSATNAPLQRKNFDRPADLYLAFVRIFGRAGVGQPSAQTGGGGAVSGAKMRATVPSILVEVERKPLVLSL